MDLYKSLCKLAHDILLVPRAMRAAWAVESAFDKAAEGKEQEAQVILNTVKHHIGFLLPEALLLEVYLLYRLEQYDEALLAADEFESSMESFKSNVLTDEESCYLVAYSKLISYSARLRKFGAAEEIPKIAKEEVDLSKVRPALKKKFPLVIHADWSSSANNVPDSSN